jgi:hypothetical protein
MSHDDFLAIQKDPASLYMHSRLGKALLETIHNIRAGDVDFCEKIKPHQKKLIADTMIGSMKKEDLFSEAMAKLSEKTKNQRDAVNIESALNSIQVRGYIKEYSVISGTMRLCLDSAQITVNTYEPISLESDKMPLNIIATSSKKKVKK